MRRSAPVTWEQVRVGILLLVGIVVLAAGVFFIGQMGGVFGERYRLVTLMRSAAGLVPGASVQLAGQGVGQVAEIELIAPEDRPETGEAVAVWLAVNRRVQPQIRSDSRARVRTQGLLGDRVVDIEPGSAGARILGPGDTLPASEPLAYQELLGQAATAVAQLTTLSRELESLTRRLLAGEGSLGRLVVDDTLYRQLVHVSGSLGDFLDRVAGGEGTLGRLLTDEELYLRLSAGARSLDSVTARVAAGRGTLGRMVVSDSLYDRVLALAERSSAILGRLEEGEGTAGRLLEDESLYEELLRTLVDLNAVLDEIRRDPRKYIPPVRVF